MRLNLLYEAAKSNKQSGHEIVVKRLLNSKSLNNYQAYTSDLKFVSLNLHGKKWNETGGLGKQKIPSHL